MGWQNLLLKGKKVAGKVIKRAKEDAPFYGMVGSALAGRQVYKKIIHGKTDWDEIKEAHKKARKRKRDASLHKGEK